MRFSRRDSISPSSRHCRRTTKLIRLSSFAEDREEKPLQPSLPSRLEELDQPPLLPFYSHRPRFLVVPVPLTSSPSPTFTNHRTTLDSSPRAITQLSLLLPFFNMRSTSVPLFALLALLPRLSEAMFFTSPATSTTWASAAGQTLTWSHQRGDPTVGTILLQAIGYVELRTRTWAGADMFLTTEPEARWWSRLESICSQKRTPSPRASLSDPTRRPTYVLPLECTLCMA